MSSESTKKYVQTCLMLVINAAFVSVMSELRPTFKLGRNTRVRENVGSRSSFDRRPKMKRPRKTAFTYCIPHSHVNLNLSAVGLIVVNLLPSRSKNIQSILYLCCSAEATTQTTSLCLPYAIPSIDGITKSVLSLQIDRDQGFSRNTKIMSFVHGIIIQNRRGYSG